MGCRRNCVTNRRRSSTESESTPKLARVGDGVALSPKGSTSDMRAKGALQPSPLCIGSASSTSRFSSGDANSSKLERGRSRRSALLLACAMESFCQSLAERFCAGTSPQWQRQHTSGRPLSALPRPWVDRGSCGCVYHGVRRWLKRSDPRAAAGDTAHRRCVAADHTGQTTCSRKRHCHFAIIARDAAQQEEPGTKQQKLSMCNSLSTVITSTVSLKVLPRERHTTKHRMQKPQSPTTLRAVEGNISSCK